MGALLGLAGLLALAVGIVVLVANAIRGKSVKEWAIVAAVGFFLFAVGLGITPSNKEAVPIQSPN